MKESKPVMSIGSKVIASTRGVKQRDRVTSFAMTGRG